MPRVLVYGYGNPGRRDDGLGPALVRELAARGVADEAGPGARVVLESGYQLQVEDAALVAGFDAVIFADAEVGAEPGAAAAPARGADGRKGAAGPDHQAVATAAPAPFALRPLEPRGGAAFTTHAVAPEEILALARAHFAGAARGYVLAIRGYDFDDFGERLSPGAQRNLAAAADFLCQALRDGRFGEPAVSAQPER